MKNKNKIKELKAENKKLKEELESLNTALKSLDTDYEEDSSWNFHWDGRGDYEERRRAFYGDFS